MLNEITFFLFQHLQNPFIVSFILGMLPISEVRGAVIYAFSIDQPLAIIPAIFSNILICPVILLFWKMLNVQKIGEFILGKSLDKKLLRFSKNYESQGILALIVFIGIPFPATGVYTATFLAEMIGISRWKIIAGSALGVLISASVTAMLLTHLL
ncbi:MAG: small multi-drug export protein [Candidatus Micrarchaeota archaeon]|nr:small multi-drug export protein [Candidatus Micrarchaeota archaeon]